MRLRNLCHLRILFDSGNYTITARHFGGEVTGRGSHLQYFSRLFSFNPLDDLGVTAIRIGALVSVLLASRVVFRFVKQFGLVEAVLHRAFNEFECVSRYVHETTYDAILRHNMPTT